MYVPPNFRVESLAAMWDLAEEIRLGCLISMGDTFLASHLPFLIDRDRGERGTLIGHMARANPQWSSLRAAAEVMVIFTGPNTYVSPGWYETSPRAPTWNYVSVEARGRPSLIEEPDALKAMVLRLSETMEPPSSDWKAADIDKAYVDRLVPGIIGFEIEISHVQAQIRLSQQNGEADRKRVLAALQDGSLREREVASAMEKYAPT
jgi:transcriptional regulator